MYFVYQMSNFLNLVRIKLWFTYEWKSLNNEKKINTVNREILRV